MLSGNGGWEVPFDIAGPGDERDIVEIDDLNNRYSLC